MKKSLTFLFSFLFILPVWMQAQSTIVFTAVTTDGSTLFCSVNSNQPFAYKNISRSLDSIAPYPGDDAGPITVSHDGMWYSFLSTRFDADAQGWEALTLVKTDFSEYEAVHDATGQLIHPEGKTMVFNEGETVAYVSGDGNHALDVFMIQKENGQWGNPVNLTADSPYDYNYFPFVSRNGAKILFDAGNEPFPSIAIGEVHTDGTGLSFPVTAPMLPDGIAVHSASYNNTDDIIFEGDAAATGERIWKLPHNSNVPELITMAYPDDNSPVTLLGGPVASLWIPGSRHQLKVMDADGSNGILLTDSSSLFTEVFDIGLSSTALSPAAVKNPTAAALRLSVYPNPSAGDFFITTNKPAATNGILEITDSRGRILIKKNPISGKIHLHLPGIKPGIYFVKYSNGTKYIEKKVAVTGKR